MYHNVSEQELQCIECVYYKSTQSNGLFNEKVNHYYLRHYIRQGRYGGRVYSECWKICPKKLG